MVSPSIPPETPPQGPRERLAMQGAQSLSDADLVALLLGTGSSVEPVAVVAARLLTESGGLHGLRFLGVRGLSQQPGIGPGKACRVQAAVELAARMHSRPLTREKALRASADVDGALGPRLRHETREHFLAIALDVKNRPVAEIELAIGGLTACAITPADAFRPVVRAAAAGVIFVHNHPSGEPAPSDQDVAMTHRLAQAGELLGVPVLDHVIVGDRGYFSFLDAGLLRSTPDWQGVDSRPQSP